MERKQVKLNPLAKLTKTMEEVIKKKEQFGEMIAEKERMSVLKELIDRNNDDVMPGTFASQEEKQSPTQLNSLHSNVSRSFITAMTRSTPDLDYYHNQNNQGPVNHVPLLDLSWLDKEDEDKEVEEGGVDRRARSFIEDSFSSEDFQYRETIMTRNTDNLSTEDDEKLVGNISYSSKEKIFETDNKIEKNIKEELDFKMVENEDRLSNCGNLTQEFLKQIKLNARNSENASKSSHISDKIYQESVEKHFFNGLRFKEISRMSRNVEIEEAKKVVTNNNHNESEIEEVNFVILKQPKAKNKFVTKFTKNIEKKNSDFSCQVEEKIDKLEMKESLDKIGNEKERSDKGDGDMKTSKDNDDEVVRISDEKVEVVESSNDAIKIKGEKEMKVMERWKEVGKKKESVARCYCFLCGVNCGIWFC